MVFGVLGASHPIADQPYVLAGEKSLQTHQKKKKESAAQGLKAGRERILYLSFWTWYAPCNTSGVLAKSNAAAWSLWLRKSCFKEISLFC